jgi:hypothetical protein
MAEPVPQAWTRETLWRQGHILKSETVSELDLADYADTCVVVISHDCDLANEDLTAEPDIEVIVGKIVSTLNGSFAWGKSPRTLHLETLRDGTPVVLELVATKKCLVPKTAVAAHTPDPAYSIEPKELGILQYWLSVRYRRAAFADMFVKRMSSTGLDRRLAKTLGAYSVVSAVYLDVDEGQEIDRSDGTAYNLSIVLTFVPGADPSRAADVAEEAEEKVEQLFSNKCYDKATNTWKHFRLKTCLAISEDDVSVTRARILKQWRLEHVSFKTDDNEPGPTAIQV